MPVSRGSQPEARPCCRRPVSSHESINKKYMLQRAEEILIRATPGVIARAIGYMRALEPPAYCAGLNVCWWFIMDARA